MRGFLFVSYVYLLFAIHSTVSSNTSSALHVGMSNIARSICQGRHLVISYSLLDDGLVDLYTTCIPTVVLYKNAFRV